MIKNPHSAKATTRPLVVGVGASAGGLEAFQEFLTALGDRPNIAVVFVQHLDAQSKNLLSQILSRSTSLRLVEVTEQTTVTINTVYVCPPQTSLEIRQSILSIVREGVEGRPSAPIDHFFHSISESEGQRGVGVILSGVGSDGTLGLKSISDSGGMTFAQEPASAKFDSMPRNAATTGVADRILPPVEIARELLDYAQFMERSVIQDSTSSLIANIEQAIPEIAEQLLQATNHNFQHYKTSTLGRRIARRMQVLRIARVGDYVERLKRDMEETHNLFRDLLIGVTAFFRDPESFQYLSDEVLPRLFAKRQPDDPVRIWVAGCATGEEAFSIAILCQEYLDRIGRVGDSPGADVDRIEVRNPAVGQPSFQVFASDIDEQALATARAGVYPVGIAENVSPERLQRFFVQKGKRFHVKQTLREKVLFSCHNLISDPPFSRLDLISCRNLLIYLGPHLQKKLVPLFHYALRPNGFLFLGPSESMSSHGELFVSLDAKHRISQRKGIAIARNAPMVARSAGSVVRTRGASALDDDKTDIVQIMQRIVLDEFAPKTVVVDETGQIVCSSAETEKYLSIGEGAYQNNILKMARRGLRIGLRAALAEAKAKRRRVTHENVSVETSLGKQRVMLTIQPMMRLGEPSGLFLVVFHDVGLPMGLSVNPSESDDAQIVRGAADRAADAMIEQLERELASTRDDLDRLMQDMEATHEEIKSSNEELLSMNDKLQSANEELETSKEEVQTALARIAQSDSDRQNLLDSTNIAILFVDDEMEIRSFTPGVTAIYNLIPTDIGRPLGHTTHRAVDMPAFPADSSRVENWPIEDEVETQTGRWFLRRIQPYMNANNERNGLVVTFYEFTEHKKLRMRLAAAHAVARLLANAESVEAVLPSVLKALRESLEAEVCLLWLVNERGGKRDKFLTCVADDTIDGLQRPFVEFSKHTRFTPGEGLPGLVWERGRPVWLEDIRSKLGFKRSRQASECELSSGVATPITIGNKFKGVIEIFTTRQLTREPDLLDLLETIGNDIGQFIRARRLDDRFRDQDARKTAILKSALDCIITMDTEGRIVDFNPAAEQTLGYSASDVVGRPLEDLIIPEQYREAHRNGLARFLSSGTARILGQRVELAALRSDGSQFPVELAVNVSHGRDGSPFFTAYLRDISQRKQAESALLERERNATLAAQLLAESQSKLSMAMRSAQMGWFEWDLGSDRQTWDEHWAEALGLSSELANAREAFTKLIHPEDVDEFDRFYQRLISLPEDESDRIDHRVTLSDGRTRWVRLQAKPIHAGNGDGRSATQLIGTVLDITQQREFENSLSEARAQAVAASESKSEFLANMSHEIRTPMTAILGYTDLLHEYVSHDEAKEHLNTIRRNGGYLLEIINDILDLSKIEAGKLEVSQELFDPIRLVEDVRSFMEVRAKESNLQLEVVYDGKIPSQIQSDSKRLKQILINLVGNAIKFTKQGQVKMIVSYANHAQAAHSLQFTIIDTGIGMSEEQMRRLFRPFEQGDSSVSRHFGGTGLGLAISRRLANMLGGDIHVESQVGKGSTFQVSVTVGNANNTRLVQPQTTVEQTEPAAMQEPGVLNCHVLVVDDRRDIRFLSSRLLTKVGATVDECEDGQLAVNHVRECLGKEGCPDLILLDMQMPNLDGYETASQLRGLGFTGPIIALTADAMQGDMNRCIECGCNDYLSKPIDAQRMLHLVAKMTNNRK
jgi:PAS domain S-box-containing protein